MFYQMKKKLSFFVFVDHFSFIFVQLLVSVYKVHFFSHTNWTRLWDNAFKLYSKFKIQSMPLFKFKASAKRLNQTDHLTASALNIFLLYFHQVRLMYVKKKWKKWNCQYLATWWCYFEEQIFRIQLHW